MEEQPMEEVNLVVVFKVGMVKMGKQKYNDWKVV